MKKFKGKLKKIGKKLVPVLGFIPVVGTALTAGVVVAKARRNSKDGKNAARAQEAQDAQNSQAALTPANAVEKVKMLLSDPAKRNTLLMIVGGVLLALFVFIRKR